MIAVRDLITRLLALGCRAELTAAKVSIVGEVGKLSEDLKAETRKLKPALVVELLREQAQSLVAFIDGDALLAERKAKLPALLTVEDRLSAAQGALWDSWRRAGFTILWSPIVEEFILVGDTPPPPGSEKMAVYTGAEVEALKNAAPERVRAAHQLKKAFNGMVCQP